MSEGTKERDFEADIEAWLCGQGGYVKADPAEFDRRLCLNPATLLAFVRKSQPKAWHLHESKNSGKAESVFINRFYKEVKNRSLLDVLRNGFKILGVFFRVVFWKPETGLNPESLAAYDANILQCVRQLHYSQGNENSVDVTLFVNGIPVVCLELKNPLTGQTVEDAVKQFKRDRSSAELFFDPRQRVLVNFAVDPYRVKMTTRLAGSKTVFLPFDQGSNGPGNVGGAGNPAQEGEGYPVSYLWQQILNKDALLELLQKYMHEQQKRQVDSKTGKEIKSDSLIFPRYHQWDVVTRLLADCREHGAGKNYLIQHSAGSGKSNSIAWLAHRLSGLHNAANQKIFHSVIVVTDRRVLDNQLQETVSQFEDTIGLVRRIKKSTELRDAINDGAAIIVTTLQKFPIIFKEVEQGGRNFAIIVDEAHSSQTGEAALKLKASLADLDQALVEYAQQEGEVEAKAERKEDKIWRELAAHGTHANLSFFAFTATPKARTLELFGEKREDGSYHAWHTYSMRQAIEEGFILDVLANYTTYKRYYQLLRKIENDPSYGTARGMKAAARFESLHPHNIAQKTAVMLEHFCEVTRHKMGGRAKAMLVTQSRLHAVRYMREFARQIKDKRLAGVGALVAFSGEVSDCGQKVSEPELNEQIHGRKISEAQLPEAFRTDFNILIVAEKYQTGFDEPLLHTMFVDKVLSGVKAVQTLSRLNRIAKDKEDTFVLDFVNSAVEIKKSFQPYYEATVLEEETDPNVLYDIKNKLDGHKVYFASEVAAVGAALEGDGDSLLEKVVRLLAPVLERYASLADEQRFAFRTGINRFVRLYSFITQIKRMFDLDLHKYAFFASRLARALPREGEGPLDLHGQIDLEFYRLQKTGEGKIELASSDAGIPGIKGEAGAAAKDTSPLSKIIEKLNERFGTQFRPEDQVHILRQIGQKVARSDPRLGDLARRNDAPGWNMVYEEAFPMAVVEAAIENRQFFEILNTQEALDFLKDELRSEIMEMSKS